MADSSREYPKFEYLEVGERPPPYDFEPMCPIVLCSRCESRYVRDWTRYPTGQKRSKADLEFFGIDVDRAPLCEECELQRLGEHFETDVLRTIERRLGLNEKDRDALRSFIETVFTDPKKILKVQELDNRVSSLEKQINVMWGIVGVLVAAVVALAIALM